MVFSFYEYDLHKIYRFFFSLRKSYYANNISKCVFSLMIDVFFERSNRLCLCFICIHQDLELSKPVDVYNLLGSQMNSYQHNDEFEIPNAQSYKSDKCGSLFAPKVCGYDPKRFEILESISRSILRRLLTCNDIQRLFHKVRQILNK